MDPPFRATNSTRPSEDKKYYPPKANAFHTARLKGRDWGPVLYPFLFTYRCIPHSTADVSPVELLYNKSLQNGIPAVHDTSNNLSTEQHGKAAALDRQRKAKL